jgi:glycine oxidase
MPALNGRAALAPQDTAAADGPGVPARASVVVVGGGIVGLSLAFALVRAGAGVLVLERDRVGAGAGGVAAGMLAPASEAEHVTASLLELAQLSHRLYPEWVRAVEQASGRPCGFRRDGTLLVALSRDDEDEIARLVAFQEHVGLSGAAGGAGAWLTPDQVHALEPNVSPRATGALHLPLDYQVDPQAMLVALERAVTALGGRIVTGARVTGFETAGGRLQQVVGRLDGAGAAVTAASGTAGGRDGGQEGQADRAGRDFAVECEAAVLAAGAWSGVDVAWPADTLGIRPVKGQLLHLSGPDLIRHVVRTPDVYLVPREGGRLVVGATMEEQGFDAAPTAGAVMDLLWNARRVLPGTYEMALADVRVGFRPATRDHLPLIGATRVPGLYVATGHFRHGVLLAPATATLLADLLTGGAHSPLLEPFRPDRERPGQDGQERAVAPAATHEA